jgi:hypothetical protein
MKRQLISGLAVSLLLTAAAFGASENAQKEAPLRDGQITIRIRDYAQTDPSVRGQAEKVAADILQKAGVATRWMECPAALPSTGACASPMSTLVLVVNLLPRSMSDRYRRAGGVLGFAVEASDSQFAYVASIFYDDVKDRAEERQLDFGDLLGAVTAHELGHLLLGTNSHSGSGLMSAFWSGSKLRIAVQGWLTFTDAEAKRISAAMAARALAAPASAEATGPNRNEPTEEQVSRGNH